MIQEQINTEDGEHQGGNVRPAVPGHVLLHRLHRDRRNLGGSHVMPLHNLVQRNPIYETTKAEP
jgi:hypothetical protein